MRNITIKMKLILSFSIIAILIAVLAGYSVFGVNKSSSGFTNYREMARDSLLASRVQANMLMIRMNVKDYLLTSSTKDITEFNAYFGKTQEFVHLALKEISNPTRAKYVKKIDEDLDKYKSNFDSVIKYMKQRHNVVENNLNVNGKKIEQLLTEIVAVEKRKKELLGSLEAAHGIRTLLLARLYTVKFLETNSEAYEKRAFDEFEVLRHELEVIETHIKDIRVLDMLEKAIALIDTYEKGLKEVVSIIKSRNVHIKQLDSIGPEIAKLAEDVKLSIKKDQDTIGPEVAQLNSSIKMIVEIISVLVVLIIIVLGVTIPKDINNKLTAFQEGLLSFFKFLNRETNDVKLLTCDSKDEIGVMSKVVNENIEKAKKAVEEDRVIIDDAISVLGEFEQGDLCQRITSEVKNPALNELKNVLNKMGSNLESNINNILDVLDEFTQYNYLKKVDTHGIKEHLEKLATGVNTLGVSITQMLINNKTNGLTLEDSSELLLKNVDVLNTSSNEAAASLEQTAAAVDEMAGNITGTTEKITHMAELANEVTVSAKRGEAAATKTTQAMDEINEQVSMINEAITVIDQIAFQTNILSLNAAVEAATAGEAGKGFAVVAQEVRNLAARSAEAAKEIKDLVENATNKANEGKGIADDMIVGFNKLSENINETLELISDVSTAAKEQQSGIVQINDAVNNLDKQTQNNASIAAHTQQIATNTSDIATEIVQDANNKEFEGKSSIQAKKLQTSAPAKKKQKIQEESKVKVEKVQELKKTQTIITDNTSDDEWESF